MTSWARSWTFLGSPRPHALCPNLWLKDTEGVAQETVQHLELQSFTCTPWIHGNSTKQYNTAKKLSGETGVQFQPPNICQLRVFDSDSQVQPEMHLINPFSGNACDICKEVTTNTIDAQMRIGPSHVGQVLPWGCHLDTFQHRVLKTAILAILVCFVVLWKPIDLLNLFIFEAEEHIEVAKFEVTSRWFGIQRTWSLKPPLWGPCCNPGAFFAECFEKPLHGANQPKLLDENERTFKDAEWKIWLKQGLGKKLLFLTSTSAIWSVYLHGRSSAKLPPSWSPGKQTPKPCWSAPAAILNCHVAMSLLTAALTVLFRNSHSCGPNSETRRTTCPCNASEQGALKLRHCHYWESVPETRLKRQSSRAWVMTMDHLDRASEMSTASLASTSKLHIMNLDWRAQKWSQSTKYQQHISDVFPGWLLRCSVKATKAHHGGILVGSKIDAGI